MKILDRYSPRLKHVTHLFCVIIGITFIASGFLKAVDPWGTAIKFEEYFIVYGLNFMLPLSRILAIWLCGAEMMMGCMIFCRVRLRLISIFALASMSLFTIITALNISLLSVDDCGCFGAALYLTPWQSLIKNLIILPMVATIWWRYRPDKILVYKQREVILATIFCVVTMSFSAYNYLHLPMIDFLPYKVGVNLLDEVEATSSSDDYSVVLHYRNIESGELHQFSVEDTAWHDDTKWEWVETCTNVKNSAPKSFAGDFTLSDAMGENATVELLSTPGKLNVICVASPQKLRKRCAKRLEKFVDNAIHNSEQTIVITAEKVTEPLFEIGNYKLATYHIDASTLNSIMRSSVGVVEIRDGVIEDKRSCIDI